MVLSLFNPDKTYLPSQKIDDYTIVQKIGEGRYGICYQVSNHSNQYILKQLKRGMLKKAGEKASFEEQTLMKLQHEGLPCFIKKIVLKNFYGYVLEYKPGRTLEDIIYLDHHRFEKAEIYQIAVQLIDIIKYLHSQGIVHRDIRIPNILYEDAKIYLIDFGLARFVNNKKYKEDIDFAFLGDLILHLYYSAFDSPKAKSRPWYEELSLAPKELMFLKKLMGIEERYNSISALQNDFLEAFRTFDS